MLPGEAGMSERVSNEQLESWLSYPDLVTTEGDLRKAAHDLPDARRERDKARKALARFPTLIEITGALVPGANPGLTARLIADYNSAEIARAAEGGGDE